MQTLIPFLAVFVAILGWGVSHYMVMILVDHQEYAAFSFQVIHNF
jgi:hypothetical protein